MRLVDDRASQAPHRRTPSSSAFEVAARVQHAVDDLRHGQMLREPGIVVVVSAGAGDERLVLDAAPRARARRYTRSMRSRCARCAAIDHVSPAGAKRNCSSLNPRIDAKRRSRLSCRPDLQLWDGHAPPVILTVRSRATNGLLRSWPIVAARPRKRAATALWHPGAAGRGVGVGGASGVDRRRREAASVGRPGSPPTAIATVMRLLVLSVSSIVAVRVDDEQQRLDSVDRRSPCRYRCCGPAASVKFGSVAPPRSAVPSALKTATTRSPFIVARALVDDRDEQLAAR